MPDPAILFLVLCVRRDRRSRRSSFWFDVKATYEVVKPPPVPTEETYYGGSTSRPTSGRPSPSPPEATRS